MAGGHLASPRPAATSSINPAHRFHCIHGAGGCVNPSPGVAAVGAGSPGRSGHVCLIPINLARTTGPRLGVCPAGYQGRGDSAETLAGVEAVPASASPAVCALRGYRGSGKGKLATKSLRLPGGPVEFVACSGPRFSAGGPSPSRHGCLGFPPPSDPDSLPACAPGGLHPRSGGSLAPAGVGAGGAFWQLRCSARFAAPPPLAGRARRPQLPLRGGRVGGAPCLSFHSAVSLLVSPTRAVRKGFKK